jgi:hypothetical protein
MSEISTPVEKHFQLSAECAERLGRLAQSQALSEDQIVEKALDILFRLTELFDESAERRGWSFLSQASLQRVWDNEEDAAYDNWKELYGVPTR